MRVLLLLSLLFISLFYHVHGQTIVNVLNIRKSSAEARMSFNIKINGVDYFTTDQDVTNLSSQYNFNRKLSDVVEVVFSRYSTFPGDYDITLQNGEKLFDSKTLDFYIVNQCVTENAACGFKINPVNLFPDGINADIYINGQLMINNYGGQGDSQTISINRGDLINVKMSGTASGDYGMNFITVMGGTAKTVAWYNNNLATQTIIPSVYFASPVEGASIYYGYDVPMVLYSYPEAKEFLVSFIYNSLSGELGKVKSQLIHSNPVTTPTFVLPTDIDPFTNDFVFKIEYPVLGEEYNGLNYVSGYMSGDVPTSITFTGAMQQSYSAGSSVPIRLTSVSYPGNYMVKLKCGSLTPVYGLIHSNTASQNFFIDDYMYGDLCIFSVSYPIDSSNTPIITVTQPVTFTEPKSSNTYYVNQGVGVLLTAKASIPDASVTVVQDCEGTIDNYLDIQVNVPFTAAPPPDFVGQCTYTSIANDLYDAADPPVTIDIQKGNIAITSPEAGARITAGTNAQIKITAVPEGNDFTVQLDCGGTMQYSDGPYISNQDTFQDFPVPSDFYGATCAFSIINLPEYYNDPSSVAVVISQAVHFTLPRSSDKYFVNQPISILLSAQASIPSNPVTVVQDCGGLIHEYSGKTVNVPFTGVLPSGHTGQCSFSSLQSGLYNAADPTVTITVDPKTGLVFVQTPRVLYNSQDFVLQINSVGAATRNSVYLVMDCLGLGEAQDFGEVPINEPVTLNFSYLDLTGGPFKCTFLATSLAYNDQTSPIVIVLTPLTPQEQTEFIRENGFAHWIMDRENVINI